MRLKLTSRHRSEFGGRDRYLTHVSTDKPIYRPGETLFVRGVILHANDRTPLPQQFAAGAVIQVRGPKGNNVASGYVNSADSVLGFQWPIPAEQAGGEYSIQVTYPNHGYPPAKRKFDIRAYRAPRLKSQIVFLRDGYGPGDKVGATLHVERAEGGIPAGAKVTVIARVDGVEAFRGPATVDAKGNCDARFELPKQIARGEGTLAMVVEDGGVVETASKTIPILLQTVDLQMYPEGGDLVAGLPTRVYLEARTPAKKPADIAGVVLDADGERVGEFRTEHEGRGRFAFKPVADGKYRLKITEPAGIKTEFPLPTVKPSGAVITASQDVIENDDAVKLKVGSTRTGRYKITLSKRETELAAFHIKLKKNRTKSLTLTPPSSADGVLVATLWSPDGQPVAERLLFRRPEKGINVKVTADENSYVPGGTAKLTVTTTDVNGEPVGAVVGLTVTDDSVLEMIEKREQAPRLPAMVFLEDDVRELADAHVYLDATNPQSPLAVDLLLGTQGWRRFAFVNVEQFLSQSGDDGRRVLALRIVTQRDGVPTSALAAPGGAVRREGGFIDEIFRGRARNKNGVVNAPKPVAAPAEAKPQDDPAVADEPVADQPAASLVELPQASAKLQLPQPKLEAAAREENDDAKKLRRALKQADGKRDADLFGLGLDIAGPAVSSFIAVRVYAHAVRPGRQPGERRDFTETLFWSAGIKTDPQTGQASVSFGLNDSVTSFRVLADAFDRRGGLGQATPSIESVKPFYVEPKLPLEVTSSDRIQLPVGIVNATAKPLSNTSVSIEANGLQISPFTPFSLDGNQRARRLVNIDVGTFTGTTDFTLRASAGPYADKVIRTLTVKPLGFPYELARGGMLFSNDTLEHQFVIPDGTVAGSVSSTIQAFPTPLANMTAALQRLIREPHGCFEQTSSTTYPLIMAQQYFQSHSGIDPALIERSNALLEKGYRRLIGFECKQRGYEWFAADPGHEALTAYGLLEFHDMAKVRSVDAEMLIRTREWLLKARDGNGGFKRERRALHRWVADPAVSNAYITWALLSAGETALEAEVAWLQDAVSSSQNSYVVALTANVMQLAGKKQAAVELMDRLVKLQSADGFINGATQSIVGSGGEALKIETTSLAVLAWLNDREYADHVEKGIQYLADACKAGRFGSTQSTVLALRAIVAYDQAMSKPKNPGSIEVLVDGARFGTPVRFDTKTEGAIELPDISEALTPGKHTVAIKMNGGSSMPHSLAVNLNTTRPNPNAECQVGLQVSLRDKTVDEGSITEAQVRVTNRADKVVPSPVAIVGIPGGLEVRHDQLKELVKSQKIAAYEVIGRDVVLYWRALDAKQSVELPISLIAAIPGSYTGPASRGYLYYTDEYKHWVDGLHVTITPAAE